MNSEIQLKLTRDSVCIADDIDNHTKIISIASPCDITKTMMDIAKEYLPSVAGYGHTWECVLNGTKCAVINGNCAKIAFIADAVYSEMNDLYFKYHSATY